jgi:fermentation-respiration switch protein FrsA (DUF1100 family)
MKTVLIVAAVLAAGVYCLVVGLLTWQQRRFLYEPDTHRPDLSVAGVPEAHAMTVHTRDGLDLLAWMIPPADDTQPVVLYLHGNGGNIGYRAHEFATVRRFGWGILMLEYRGYGGNAGTPTETGLYEDARAAYAALRTLGIPAGRILLWGESLGTGVAVHLAAEHQVGAVLLEAPYTSIAAIARKRFPFVPIDLLLRDRFDLIGRIGSVRAPVLVMTGGRDNVIPPAMGRAVFDAANEPKRFWLVPEAGHNNLLEAGAFNVARAFVADHWKAAE